METGHRRWILTGGIGSGKSTVGEMLRRRGAKVIDADRLGHRVLEPDGPAFASVAARWPGTVVGGRIDRRALGRLVFTDPELLAELEALTHPHIAGLLRAQVCEAAPDELVIVEISVPRNLLGEGWLILVVDAPDHVRHRRLRGRGMEPEEIEQRMASQPDRGRWLEVADRVITNDAGFDDLAQQVEGFLASAGHTRLTPPPP